jgi:thiamine-monophosphate kinase
LRENRESFFIKEFQSKYIGDDGAVIEKEIYVQDGFFEGVHFKREWFSLDEIAYKSVSVNVSDIYSMNGFPKYGLITVAIPKSFSKEDLKLLASGFKRAEKDFDFEIIGGDTISNSKLDISVTVVGELRGKPLLRSGVKNRDFILYTGTIGKSKRDLQSLFKNRGISRNSVFIKPKLQKRFIYKSSNFLNSGLDISDGLYSELSHLSKMSKIAVKLSRNFSKDLACSGEEYQLLFSVSPQNLKRVFYISKSLGVKLNFVGRAKRGELFKNRCKAHHF